MQSCLCAALLLVACSRVAAASCDTGVTISGLGGLDGDYMLNAGSGHYERTSGQDEHQVSLTYAGDKLQGLDPEQAKFYQDKWLLAEQWDCGTPPPDGDKWCDIWAYCEKGCPPLPNITHWWEMVPWAGQGTLETVWKILPKAPAWAAVSGTAKASGYCCKRKAQTCDVCNQENLCGVHLPGCPNPLFPWCWQSQCPAGGSELEKECCEWRGDSGVGWWCGCKDPVTVCDGPKIAEETGDVTVV